MRHHLATGVDAGHGSVIDFHARQVHRVCPELQRNVARHILLHRHRPGGRPYALDQVLQLVHHHHARQLWAGRPEPRRAVNRQLGNPDVAGSAIDLIHPG